MASSIFLLIPCLFVTIWCITCNVCINHLIKLKMHADALWCYKASWLIVLVLHIQTYTSQWSQKPHCSTFFGMKIWQVLVFITIPCLFVAIRCKNKKYVSFYVWLCVQYTISNYIMAWAVRPSANANLIVLISVCVHAWCSC